MNDLALLQQARERMPRLFKNGIETLEVLLNIKSFEDVERTFLKGAGLSPHTYSSYLTAIKQFYEFMGSMPTETLPADIESFYDHLVKTTSRNTAYVRIEGLKKFFKNARLQIPWISDPFDIMNEVLKSKLSKTLKGQKKKALYLKEIRGTLKYINQDKTIMGLQNKAIILSLLTSGLRAQELCNLQGSDLEHDTDSDRWYVSGIGKGEKPFKQEIHPTAVKAIMRAFKEKHHRAPRGSDFLLHSNGTGRLMKSIMWIRLAETGKKLKSAGIIRQDLEFSAHLFRRSYLTALHKEGMPLAALQQAARHSNVDTTFRNYVDVEESTKGYLDRAFFNGGKS